MTYKSRGRSMVEIIVAVTFVGFLTGFVAVLCIGNYYRAKRAMENQKQRRLARLSGNAGNGVIGIDSPGSNQSTVSSAASAAEQHHLLGNQGYNAAMSEQTTRRRNVDERGETLLLDLTDTGPRTHFSPM